MSETAEKSQDAGTAVMPAPRLPMPKNYSHINAEQWRVLTDAIFPAAKTTESIVLALDYCRARNLDPFKRAVHIVPMWNRALRREVETVWPGIIELETTAARSKQWAGMDEPKWGPLVEKTFDAVENDERGAPRRTTVTVRYPEWCSVTVYRLIGDKRYAFSEPVFWDEAYGRVRRSEMPNEMWRKRPRGQLHKNAKAASLRAAFPEDAGDYAAEEMEGREIDAGGVVIEGSAIPSGSETPAPRHVAPAPRRKLGAALEAIEGQLQAALTDEDLDALERDDDVRYINSLADSSTSKISMKERFAFHRARVRAFTEPPQDEAGADEPLEPLEPLSEAEQAEAAEWAEMQPIDPTRSDEDWVAYQARELKRMMFMPKDEARAAFDSWRNDANVLAYRKRLSATRLILFTELNQAASTTHKAIESAEREAQP